MIALAIVVSYVLGVISSIRAIMNTRTEQGTIAWAVSLKTFPYVAVPAYWALEITAAISDAAFAAEVELMFEADSAPSGVMDPGEYRRKPWSFRFGVRLSSACTVSRQSAYPVRWANPQCS